MQRDSCAGIDSCVHTVVNGMYAMFIVNAARTWRQNHVSGAQDEVIRISGLVN